MSDRGGVARCSASLVGPGCKSFSLSLVWLSVWGNCGRARQVIPRPSAFISTREKHTRTSYPARPWPNSSQRSRYHCTHILKKGLVCLCVCVLWGSSQPPALCHSAAGRQTDPERSLRRLPEFRHRAGGAEQTAAGEAGAGQRFAARRRR